MCCIVNFYQRDSYLRNHGKLSDMIDGWSKEHPRCDKLQRGSVLKPVQDCPAVPFKFLSSQLVTVSTAGREQARTLWNILNCWCVIHTASSSGPRIKDLKKWRHEDWFFFFFERQLGRRKKRARTVRFMLTHWEYARNLFDEGLRLLWSRLYWSKK